MPGRSGPQNPNANLASSDIISGGQAVSGCESGPYQQSHPARDLLEGSRSDSAPAHDQPRGSTERTCPVAPTALLEPGLLDGDLGPDRVRPRRGRERDAREPTWSGELIHADDVRGPVGSPSGRGSAPRAAPDSARGDRFVRLREPCHRASPDSHVPRARRDEPMSEAPTGVLAPSIGARSSAGGLACSRRPADRRAAEVTGASRARRPELIARYFAVDPRPSAVAFPAGHVSTASRASGRKVPRHRRARQLRPARPDAGRAPREITEQRGIHAVAGSA